MRTYHHVPMSGCCSHHQGQIPCQVLHRTRLSRFLLVAVFLLPQGHTLVWIALMTACQPLRHFVIRVDLLPKLPKRGLQQPRPHANWQGIRPHTIAGSCY
jgi:hypothetical protein